MEQLEATNPFREKNLSQLPPCRSGELPALFINSVYLCAAITAMFLNGIVLIGLTHISYSYSSKRFYGIRRSYNRGHPRFMLKGLQYSKSVKTPRVHTYDIEKEGSSFKSDGTSINRSSASQYSYKAIHRSPSCPERIYARRYSQLSSEHIHNNYWLNQLHIGRKRSVKHSPQPKARLTTALYLVYSLILADLLNGMTTAMNLLLSFWRPAYAFIALPNGVSQVEPVEPCARLLLSCLLYTSYNASLCSVTGLMFDLYLGVVRSMHYRVLSKSKLLRFICAGWAFSLILGGSQMVTPPHPGCSKSATIQRRFLNPSEPCTISRSNGMTNFCLLRGSANTFRGGFITGGLLFVNAIIMNALCILSLRKVRNDALKRTRTMRTLGTHRSASLPTINRVNGVSFSLSGLRNPGLTIPKFPPRCTGRKLLRSAFTLLSLTALFIVFFVPSLTMDIFFLLTGMPPKMPPWIFNLVTNMPICVALLNPIVYSLRLSDIHVGLRNFRKRLMARSEKSFVRKQLRLHRESILMSTKVTAHLRIRLPPKEPNVVAV